MQYTLVGRCYNILTAELMFCSTPLSHLQYQNETNLIGEYDNLELAGFQKCLIKNWLAYSRTSLQYTWPQWVKVTNWIETWA